MFILNSICFLGFLEKRVRVRNFGIDETQIDKLVDFVNKSYTRVIWNFHFQSLMFGYLKCRFSSGNLQDEAADQRKQEGFQSFLNPFINQ